MAFGDLCALDDVKAWLNLSTSADDALLSRLITAASQYIQRWLNRPLPLADYIETRDGLGGIYGPEESRFPFGVQPCVAVSFVAVAGVTISPAPDAPAAAPGQSVSTYYVSQPGYLFTESELVIRGYYLPRQAGCVFIQYTAGYAAIPPDLAQACIELVAQRYRERTRTGEVSRRIGTEVVRYSQLDMSAAIKTLIQQYRLVAPMFARAPQLAPTQSDPATVAAALS
jgi:Phage gp6-like head-tail connector protein